MLYISIVTLLFTHNGISSIQAEEIEERTPGVFSRMIPIMIPINLAHLEQSFQDGIPGDGGNIVLGAQTYQSGMTFNVDPNGPNIFGAYTNHVNQNFKFVGNQNQAQPNGGGIQYGSSTVQINNHYKTRKCAKNSNEPRGYQSGHAQPEVNAETEKKSQNTAESQAHAAQPNSSMVSGVTTIKKKMMMNHSANLNVNSTQIRSCMTMVVFILIVFFLLVLFTIFVHYLDETRRARRK